MQKVVIDCTPSADSFGRSTAPLSSYVDLTQAEIDAHSALVAPAQVTGLTSCAGRVAVAVLDGVSKAIVFRSAMRSADYVVTFNPAALSVRLWATSKTTSGFTLNLSLAVDGTIEYIAQEVT
jgi:hypothetical protein